MIRNTTHFKIYLLPPSSAGGEVPFGAAFGGRDDELARHVAWVRAVGKLKCGVRSSSAVPAGSKLLALAELHLIDIAAATCTPF